MARRTGGINSRWPQAEAPMYKGTFTVTTSRRVEFLDITALLEKEITAARQHNGICYLYNPHTTAGLTINEGADPAVQDDIIGVLNRIIPHDYPYTHLEGNSPAHIKASLMGSSIMVFVDGGRLELGTWQRIFFCEFDGPRTRKVHWRLI